jgi:hypothetical protein
VVTNERKWNSNFKTIELAGDARRKAAFDALPNGAEILDDQGRPIGIKQKLHWISRSEQGTTSRFIFTLAIPLEKIPPHTVDGLETPPVVRASCAVCGEVFHRTVLDKPTFDIYETGPHARKLTVRHRACIFPDSTNTQLATCMICKKEFDGITTASNYPMYHDSCLHQDTDHMFLEGHPNRTPSSSSSSTQEEEMPALVPTSEETIDTQFAVIGAKRNLTRRTGTAAATVDPNYMQERVSLNISPSELATGDISHHVSQEDSDGKVTLSFRQLHPKTRPTPPRDLSEIGGMWTDYKK